MMLLIGMTSCSKEEIVTEDPIIKIDPPKEVEYPVAKGIVKDKDGLLSAAQVLVYQGDELKGETSTDDDGVFSTINIETEIGKDIIIEFAKEEYTTTYRKRSGDDLKDKTLDVELINAEEIYGTASSVANPTDEYISLSGYIKTLDGSASRAQIAVEYMLDDVYYSATQLSDSDGYYELLLAKDTELRVSIFADTICFNYLTELETSIFLGLLAEVMGPFSDDVVLDDYINPYNTARVFDLSGQITNCEGAVPAFSTATISINDNEDHNYTYVIDCEADGSFALTENDCIAIPYTVTVVGDNLSDNMHSDTLTVTITDAEYTNNNISLPTCNTTITGYSEAIVLVDGVTYVFNQITARLENGNLISDDQQSLRNALFTIPNVQLGTDNTIIGLSLLDWSTGIGLIAVENEMDVSVATLTEDYATVLMSGDFTFNGNEVVNASCVLKLNF